MPIAQAIDAALSTISRRRRLSNRLIILIVSSRDNVNATSKPGFSLYLQYGCIVIASLAQLAIVLQS